MKEYYVIIYSINNSNKILVENLNILTILKNSIVSILNTGLNDQIYEIQTLSCFISIIVIVILLIFYYFNLKKYQNLKKEYEISKDKRNYQISQFLEKIEGTIKKHEDIVENQRNIAQELHDKFIGSLVSLRYFIENIELNKSNTTESDKELNILKTHINKIYKQSRELSDILTQNTRKIQSSLTDYLLDITSDLTKLSGPSVTLLIDKEKLEKSLTLEQHIHLYGVLSEAITNILKHARADHIEIKVVFEKQVCLFSISDNGIGFITNQYTAGLGLQNMRRRLEQLGGEITIDSDQNGTRISGKFPVAD